MLLPIGLLFAFVCGVLAITAQSEGKAVIALIAITGIPVGIFVMFVGAVVA